MLVEAAWIAVEHHPLWKVRFERLAARTGKKKAIIAIARKLLVVMWNVLTHQEADRYAEVEAVGRKFMRMGRSPSHGDLPRIILGTVCPEPIDGGRLGR